MEDKNHKMPPIPWPDDARYTASYCEESVYLLAARCTAMTHEAIYVVFISNPNKTVVLFESRAAPEHTESRRFPIFWDYHVILLIPSNSSGAFDRRQTWVYDFDSRLHKPCKLEEYLDRTLHPNRIQYPERWKSQFRVVGARNFLDYFASDRSHMIRQHRAEDREGEGDIHWLAPPPSYPVIKGDLAETLNNLFSHYVDMEFVDEASIVPDSQSLPKYGYVMSEAQLRLFFRVSPAPESPYP